MRLKQVFAKIKNIVLDVIDRQEWNSKKQQDKR